MHENPLLPNARLKEMYALMQRCRLLAQQTRPTQPRLEAILAASMLHLEAGDVCLPLPGSRTSEVLSAERLADHADALHTPQPDTQAIHYAVGTALALKLQAARRYTLTYTPTGSATARSQQGWQDSLAYAFSAQLPLVLLCADHAAKSPATNTNAITWPMMSKFAKKLRLPVLTVDGADAVAVYRVMQESAHRARQGDGLAVIWCALPPVKDKSAASDPLRKMKAYLSVRGLLSTSAR